MTLLPQDIRFMLNDKSQLILIEANGMAHENVYPVWLFPLTRTDQWISLFSEDGREIICIEDPKKLNKASYELLMATLRQHHFVPIIQEIHSITRLTNIHEWSVTTDYGPMKFDVETDENIQPLGHNRLVVIDCNNKRYLIPDVENLDRESKRKLDHYY